MFLLYNYNCVVSTLGSLTTLLRELTQPNPLKRPKGLIFVDFKGFAAFLFWFSRHLVDILYFVSTMGYADNEWLEECNNNCEKDDSISYITIGTTNLSNGWFY